jgi:hypothetical protein
MKFFNTDDLVTMRVTGETSKKFYRKLSYASLDDFKKVKFLM